mgnify:CR=1 FL=1
MNIGRAVRECRTRRGLTQKELAAGSGLDPSYVSLIESGRRIPSLDVLTRVAEYMAIPVYMMVLLGCDDDDLVIAGDRERAYRVLDKITRSMPPAKVTRKAS